MSIVKSTLGGINPVSKTRTQMTQVVLADADGAIAVDQALNYLITMTPTAPRTVTLPSASDLRGSYVLNGMDVSDAVQFQVRNDAQPGLANITLVPGAGGTASGNLVVPAGGSTVVAMRVDRLSNTYTLFDLGPGSAVTAVTDDLDIYVSPTGDDNNSGLTVTEPVLTLQRALNISQRGWNVRGEIHLSSGTHAVSGLYVPTPVAGSLAQILSISGPTPVETFSDTVGGLSVLNQNTTITVAGPLVPGALVGNLLRMTSGAAVGVGAFVGNNTATTLIVPKDFVTAGAVLTDTFVLERPDATLSFSGLALVRSAFNTIIFRNVDLLIPAAPPGPPGPPTESLSFFSTEVFATGSRFLGTPGTANFSFLAFQCAGFHSNPGIDLPPVPNIEDGVFLSGGGLAPLEVAFVGGAPVLAVEFTNVAMRDTLISGNSFVTTIQSCYLLRSNVFMASPTSAPVQVFDVLSDGTGSIFPFAFLLENASNMRMERVNILGWVTGVLVTTNSTAGLSDVTGAVTLFGVNIEGGARVVVDSTLPNSIVGGTSDINLGAVPGGKSWAQIYAPGSVADRSDFAELDSQFVSISTLPF